MKTVNRMTSQIDEFYEFYKDSGEESGEDEKFLEEQLKRWNKLKLALLVVSVVIVTLVFIKCMKCWIRSKNKKSEFEFHEKFMSLKLFPLQF